jgi:hypothetical protein
VRLIAWLEPQRPPARLLAERVVPATELQTFGYV